MQNRISYNAFTVYLKSYGDATLPDYHGSMLRGVIGRTIRQVSCTNENEICENCTENKDCPYTKIFYGINFTDSTLLKGIDKVPNPFIIEPMMNGITRIKKGELLKFKLIVLGDSLNYLSYYFHAIYKIADRGLSKNNVKFTVDRILDGNNTVVADENMIYFDKIKPAYFSFSNTVKQINDIIVYFETPARIKSNGRMVQNLSFEVFVKSLLRRITLLSEFYNEDKIEFDYTGLLEKAKDIRVYENNTIWVSQERYSSRTDKHISIGGMTGKISYSGDMSDFYNILELGKLIHVGKGCVMGLGKYNYIINN